MKKLMVVVVLLVSGALGTPSVSLAASDQSSEGEKMERVVVQYKEEIDLNILKDIPHTIHYRYDSLNSVAVTIPDNKISDLEGKTAVKSIEEDGQVQVSFQEASWGTDTLEMNKSRAMGLTGEGVKIAVLDTGVASNHPDLNVAKGISFVEGTDGYEDDNGHGTHVTGIIGAQDNEIGTVGIAPNAEIYAVKVLDEEGNGLNSEVVAGIDWAIDQNVDIINLSLTSCKPSELTKNAIKKARNAGVQVVAAAGNKDVCESENINDILYPARFPEVVSVGAVTKKLDGSDYTYDGPSLDFTAPGARIESTYITNDDFPTGYATMSGSSMAAPHVTGVLALYEQLFPEMSDSERKELLISNSLDKGAKGKDNTYGHGVAQAPTTPFKDFNRSHWYSSAVENLSLGNLISGYDDGMFKAKRSITREEAVTMVGRALKLNGEERATDFSDVSPSSFGSGYISAGTSAGFVSGYTDGTFRPNQAINRGDVAMIIDRAFNIEGSSSERFSDVREDAYYYESIHDLKAAGLISGYPDGTFNPSKEITRAEFSLILSKVLNQ
ncbi:S8 family peptidase [Halobacillus sp. K22]|uniref:S8 family peptidase n=1 Tax=Halobacillus sp. K22 TaxID=3457431 RepID=UPI003FCD014A